MRSHTLGALPDGRTVAGLVLANSTLEMHVIAYGAIIKSLRTAARDGRHGDVVLGHPDIADYCSNPHYLGAVVGRYANRIAGGRLLAGGNAVQLVLNDGPHHLHGGANGFDRQIWTVTADSTDERASLALVSPAGDQGYPGTVDASVTYRLSAGNVVEIRYTATTDAETPVNLTQHTYFNLSADPSSSVLDHELTIHADEYIPVDATLIPEGAPTKVENTPFDFRKPRVIGEALTSPNEQLRRGNGFDHNWVLRENGASLRPAARLRHPASGRILDIATTEPGLQFYGGQLLGRGDAPVFRSQAGLCLETQHFPDSPNRPDFPSPMLHPGQRYESLTTWTFSVE